MLSILFFTAAWVACLAKSHEYYFYSPAVGLGSGTPFSSSGIGAITGVKVWELSNSYITGIQLRNHTKWGHVMGRVTTSEVRMDLFEGEAIIQMSFNFYPTHSEAELRLLSGRYNGNGITSLGAHWGLVYTEDPMEERYKKITAKPKA
ncbi:hypothetical protein NHX12_001404 [Muraenolepis orangiensis]|uniref:Jacalin-type lectin domain-containing protein n=1 Tax=Muraenolepis orangiensis TaxID=630683 RepID=A0A9Q0E2E5_9TELE|nr:hypothetical protein NHX12_001404 [Muraenolepis orangiensis]